MHVGRAESYLGALLRAHEDGGCMRVCATWAGRRAAGRCQIKQPECPLCQKQRAYGVSGLLGLWFSIFTAVEGCDALL